MANVGTQHQRDSDGDDDVDEVIRLRDEVAHLRAELTFAYKEIASLKSSTTASTSTSNSTTSHTCISCLECQKLTDKAFSSYDNRHHHHHHHQSTSSSSLSSTLPCLSKHEIARYSRQLLVKEIGVLGQQRIKASSVLIVGAGGLGAPNALYLAAAGIGHIGIVDFDVVEESNLHRQVIHNEARIGVSKAASAAIAMSLLNSGSRVTAYKTPLTSKNAAEIVGSFDVVVDASDNAPTRYLINDACVLAGRPLVSGSALRLEGQLTVYNVDNGPCYRCLYPRPPPASTVTNCSNGGVLGIVPGIIGSLQALETLKICAGMNGESLSRRLLLLDAAASSIRIVKLRSRKPDCAVCGDTPSISDVALQDYEAFCGSKACDGPESLHLLHDEQRIEPDVFKRDIVDASVKYVLLDCRDDVQRAICSLPYPSIHVPLSRLATSTREESTLLSTDRNTPVFVFCRLGNDSQLAVQVLTEAGFTNARDIRGGLKAWMQKVDNDFPFY